MTEANGLDDPHGASAPRDRDAEASWIVLVCALVLFGVLANHMAPYLPDDAFISYRYAANLGTGNGLTFNAHEPPVEGYSNFSWILIAALVRWLGGSPLLWMPRVGVLAGMLSVVFLWLMYRRRNVSWTRTILPLALLCTSGPLMLYAVSGFETPLFSLLLLVLLWTLDKVMRTNATRHWLAATAVGVLLFLTRPEGIVAFPVVLALVVLWNVRAGNGKLGPALLMALLFLIAFGGYTYWRVHYFHEVLPTPFLSKAGGGGSLKAAWSTNFGMYFKRQGFAESAVAPFGYYYLGLGLAAIGGLFLSGSLWPEKQTEVAALILGLLLSLLYCNFVDWYPVMRYHSALTPLFFLPGVWLGNVRIDWGELPTQRTARVAGLVLVGLAVVTINLGIFQEVRMEAVRSTFSAEPLIALGKWLKKSAPAEALLATPDVGMVPYYSELRTLDSHPEALVDLHTAKEGFSPDYLFARDPTFLMLASRRGKVFRKSEQEVMRDARFSERYQLLDAIRLGWFEDSSYRVYVKRGVAIRAAAAAEFPKGVSAGVQ